MYSKQIMRFLIQVVQHARIKVAQNELDALKVDCSSMQENITEYGYEATIWTWLLIYMSVSTQDLLDYPAKIAHFVSKIHGLQVFHRDGKIIGTLEECGWEILLIPNFTLYGQNRKWMRFDFADSAPFQDAKRIFDELILALENDHIPTKSGVFGAFMEIDALNAGPINFVMDI